MQAQADGAERAIAKLHALMTRQTAARIEPDLEVLTEAKGLAMRPGPKPKINQAILCSLRQAIITQRKVRLHYLYRTTRRRGYQTVHPYGYQSGYLADARRRLYKPAALQGRGRRQLLDLTPDGSEITTLGQANARFKFAQQELTVGRQLVRTPFINPYYDRIIPLTYEGVMLIPEDNERRKLDYVLSYL